MMGTGDIRNSLRRIVGSSDNVFVIAKVDKVDGVMVDVTPVDDDLAPICGVRLKATDADDGLVMVPKVGSVVIVAMMSEVDGCVAMWSEIESVKLIIGDSKVEMTGDKVVFNGGENKGLVIAEKVAAKIEALEKDINSLKQATTTWVPAPMDGGAALKGAIASWAAQMIQPTTKKEDIMNDKVTH